jgi:protease-4
MPQEDVDKIGEGRVWSGVDAKQLNLIDDFGGLYDAIDLAAEISGLEAYRILELPMQKNPLDQLLEDLTAGAASTVLKAELGPFYKDYMQLKSALSWEGVQARLPFQATVE